MKAVVFGSNGQDGTYLVELLSGKGIETVGVSRSGPWRQADVGCLADVEAVVRDVRPNLIFHLAANSTTRHDALFENHETIATGSLNVLECARRHCPDARVFIAGSAVQFRNSGAPIDEETPFEATSPYAVARIQSVFAARYYRSLGLRTYVGYLFHHESPRRKTNHLSKVIALAAQRIASGAEHVLDLGDISVVKEWTFAGDTMRAILCLVEQDDIFEAVIGSGEGHSVEEWLDCCFSRVGLSWRDHVRLKEGFRAEYQYLLSCPTRIKSLGWTPTVSFPALAEMMMASEER
jgi:GDPmannose 4,6-dehydratase